MDRRVGIGFVAASALVVSLLSGISLAQAAPTALSTMLKALRSASSYSSVVTTTSANAHQAALYTTVQSNTIVIRHGSRASIYMIISTESANSSIPTIVRFLSTGRNDCTQQQGSLTWSCTPSRRSQSSYLSMSAADALSPFVSAIAVATGNDKTISGIHCHRYNLNFASSDQLTSGALYVSVASHLPIRETISTRSTNQRTGRIQITTSVVTWSKWNNRSLHIPSVPAI